MATNKTYETSDTLSLPVASGVVSGDPVQVGALTGVALTDRGEGNNPATYATVQLAPAPTFALAVEADDGAVSIGDLVYIDSSGDLSNTATSNTVFGVALDAVDSAATTTIAVRLVSA